RGQQRQETRQWCREERRGGTEVASVAEEGATEEEVAAVATVEEGRCGRYRGGATVAASEDTNGCLIVMKKRRKGRAAWAGMASDSGREERQQQSGKRAMAMWLGSGEGRLKEAGQRQREERKAAAARVVYCRGLDDGRLGDGSGCVAMTRAVSGGCAWSRKDSDGRWEEAAGA
ncbi:hypothetical protein BHM03_00045265, partial [Ensete ventricosum]